MIDLTKPTTEMANKAVMDKLIARKAEREKLWDEAEALETEIARLKAARYPGGVVETDLRSFPSTRLVSNPDSS